MPIYFTETNTLMKALCQLDILQCVNKMIFFLLQHHFLNEKNVIGILPILCQSFGNFLKNNL